MIFFIIGVPRSGTNFLAAILGNRTDVYMDKIPHGAILCRTMIGYRNFLRNNPLEKQKVLIKSLKTWRDDRLTTLFKPEEWDGVEPLSSFFTGALKRKAQETGVPVWGDRTPRGLLHVATLNEYFPEARFIHIVRDGRSNALSFKERAHKNLLLGGQEWLEENAQGLVHAQIIGPERYKIVRYEDILRSPEATISDICQYLTLPYQPEMLDLSQSKAAQVENAYIQKKLDVSKIDGWEKKMTSDQILSLEKIQGKMLECFGYELKVMKSSDQTGKMSTGKRIWLVQKDAFKLLFRTKTMHMTKQQWVEKKLPFSRRLKGFSAATAKNIFSEQLLAVLKKRFK